VGIVAAATSVLRSNFPLMPSSTSWATTGSVEEAIASQVLSVSLSAFRQMPSSISWATAGNVSMAIDKSGIRVFLSLTRLRAENESQRRGNHSQSGTISSVSFPAEIKEVGSYALLILS